MLAPPQHQRLTSIKTAAPDSGNVARIALELDYRRCELKILAALGHSVSEIDQMHESEWRRLSDLIYAEGYWSATNVACSIRPPGKSWNTLYWLLLDTQHELETQRRMQEFPLLTSVSQVIRQQWPSPRRAEI